MQPKHYTTRLFIGLFIITMLVTYIALTLTTQYNQTILENAVSDLLTTPKQKVTPAQTVKLLPTTDWPLYTDKTYPISFNYPKGWIVQSALATQTGFYDITIKPTDGTPNFHIVISDKEFFALDGLKQQPFKVNNVEGISINESLVGIKTGKYYYTFDASLNSKKLIEFKTLMSTVKFQ